MIFNNYDELCEAVDFAWEDTLCGTDVIVIAKYDVMRQFLDAIIKYSDNYYIENIELESPIVQKYFQEYILYISGGTGEIWVEKLKNDKGYLLLEDDNIVFVHEDCNPECYGDNDVIIFDVDDYDMMDDNIKGFNAHFSKNGNYYGFSFYSEDDELVNKMAEMVEKFVELG